MEYIEVKIRIGLPPLGIQDTRHLDKQCPFWLQEFLQGRKFCMGIQHVLKNMTQYDEIVPVSVFDRLQGASVSQVKAGETAAIVQHPLVVVITRKPGPRMLEHLEAGPVAAAQFENLFTGSYLNNYSWGETTLAMLLRRQDLS